MEEVTVEQIMLEERKFLHDLSNQIVIAQGMATIVLKKMGDVKSSIDDDILSKQEKAVNALNNQVKLLKERRSVLHSRA